MSSSIGLLFNWGRVKKITLYSIVGQLSYQDHPLKQTPLDRSRQQSLEKHLSRILFDLSRILFEIEFFKHTPQSTLLAKTTFRVELKGIYM